jgi:hypothetical protein
MFLYLVLVRGKVVDQARGDEDGDDEEGGAEDPPTLVIVPPDLEHGDPIEEAQHQ